MQIKQLLKKDKFSIRCSTEEQAKSLFTFLSIYGFSWTSGNKLSLYYLKWDSYKEKTVYNFDCKNKKITYSKSDSSEDYFEFTEINFCNNLCNNVTEDYEYYYTTTYDGKYCSVYYGVPTFVDIPVLQKYEILKSITLRPDFDKEFKIVKLKIWKI